VRPTGTDSRRATVPGASRGRVAKMPAEMMKVTVDGEERQGVGETGA
jgi:hypothetical protein